MIDRRAALQALAKATCVSACNIQRRLTRWAIETVMPNACVEKVDDVDKVFLRAVEPVGVVESGQEPVRPHHAAVFTDIPSIEGVRRWAAQPLWEQEIERAEARDIDADLRVPGGVRGRHRPRQHVRHAQRKSCSRVSGTSAERQWRRVTRRRQGVTDEGPLSDAQAVHFAASARLTL